MIYFLYGGDSYRSKRKLEEIISGYKKVHKSGLNLIYIDAKETNFDDFYSNFKITSMFAEKKLIILRNVFGNAKFQEEFLENIKDTGELKDIVVIHEDIAVDQRTKLFKALIKFAKCQEFDYLQPVALRRWVLQEFEKNKVKINPDALGLLIEFVKNDLWQMTNEINKLSNYRKGAHPLAGLVKKEDVELLIKPNVENDIFKTIDALASKDKKQALNFLYKHLESGDNPLYILSMIGYQFRTLLTIKELMEKKYLYADIAKKSGLHPFVVQKSYYLCRQFTMERLKRIYQKIFQADLDIKTGKIEAETALNLLVSEV